MVQQGLAVAPPLEPEGLLHLAERNAIHASCMAAKTVDSVGHGWTLNSMRGDAETDVQREILALTALLEDITPEFTFAELLQQARWEAEAVGWSAWEVARENDEADGDIIGLFPLPIHTLRASRLDGHKRGLYVQLVGTETRYFVEFNSGIEVDHMTGRPQSRGRAMKLARELIVFRPYSYASRHYGIPSWISCTPTIAELAAIREYNLAYFDSAGLADALVHVNAGSEGEAKRIAEDIKDRIDAASGQGHYMVITWGDEISKVQHVPLGKNVGQSREGHFLGRKEDLTKEVLIAHQVPPYRVGWAELGSLGGSAAREMLRAYREGAIEPWQIIFESRLAKTLFGPRGINLEKRGLRWALKDLDWDQMEFDLSMAAESIRLAIITPNEGRQVLGMPKKDDPMLDKHYMNGVPVDQLEVNTQESSFGGGGNAPPEMDDDDNEEDPEPAQLSADDIAKGDARIAKVEGQRTKFIPRMASVMRGFLLEEGRAVERIVRESKGNNARAMRRIEEELEARSNFLKQLFARTGREVAAEFGSEALEHLMEGDTSPVGKDRKKPAKPAKPSPKKPERPQSIRPGVTPKLRQSVLDFLGGQKPAGKVIDVWQTKVDRWIKTTSGKKIQDITETSLGKIRDQLMEGTAAGEGIDEIAARIQSAYGDEMTSNRAERIARTEVIAASNMGGLEAANAAAEITGRGMIKTWLSTKDARTREAHVKANGQERASDKPFRVDGEKLAYPGDTTLGASPENVIQCRCAVSYRLERKKD